MITGPRVVQTVWSVGAQLLSSLSNFALQMGLVLTLSTGGFGSMVVGLSVYYLTLALGRAWVGDPLIALSQSVGSQSVGSGLSWSLGRERLLRLAFGGAVVLVLFSVVASAVRFELLLLACAMPLLLMQDGYRFLAWARRRPQIVVALDGLWVGAALAVITGFWIVAGEPPTARWILVSWLIGGVVSCGAGAGTAATGSGPAARVPSVMHPHGDADLSDGEREASTALARSQALLAVDAAGQPAAVAAVAGATVTAGIRAATLPFAPLTSILSAIRILVLPVLRQAVIDGHVRATIVKVVGLFAAVGAALAAASLALVMALPASWLGETGELVRPWYPLMALIVVVRMVSLPLSDVLSLGAGSDRVVTLRLGTAAIDWAAVLVGAISIGLAGAITARAVAAVITIAWWSTAVVHAVDHDGDQPREP